MLLINYTLYKWICQEKIAIFSWVAKKDANSLKNEAFQDCMLYSIPFWCQVLRGDFMS